VNVERMAWWGSVQHRHGDEWYEMEERSPAHRPDDPEREWANTRIYHCAQCDEEVRFQQTPERRR
jgi:hypothetical protein